MNNIKLTKINKKIDSINEYKDRLQSILENRVMILEDINNLNDDEINEVLQIYKVKSIGLSIEKKISFLIPKLEKEIEYNKMWISISNNKIDKLKSKLPKSIND